MKRRLRPAWVVRADGGEWRPRRGRPVDGALDERSALVALAATIDRHEVERRAAAPSVEPTFADAVQRWLHHQEFVAGVKPSTLADYRYLLAAPDTLARPRGREPSCRILRAFGSRPLHAITVADVGAHLASLAAEPSVGTRTVNKHRQTPFRRDRAARHARALQEPRRLVLCSAVGDHLDGSALRRRYRRAQDAAGLRPLRFHDLRHSFGSLVIRGFDLVSVKSFMGHAKITTTERYLHARPRRDDAGRMTKVFEASVAETQTRELERWAASSSPISTRRGRYAWTSAGARSAETSSTTP